MIQSLISIDKALMSLYSLYFYLSKIFDDYDKIETLSFEDQAYVFGIMKVHSMTCLNPKCPLKVYNTKEYIFKNISTLKALKYAVGIHIYNYIVEMFLKFGVEGNFLINGIIIALRENILT